MQFSRLVAFATLATCSQVTLGALYSDPSQLPSNTTYDYIVVGSGAGGGVIANRLSEDPSVNVLVIEAGGDSEGLLTMSIPFFGPTLTPDSAVDWNFTTIPQEALYDRTVPYARGHVLGGSTSVNFMVYTRGAKDDFDRWANYTGDDGWSWDALMPYILKMENMTTVTETDKLEPAVHGTTGLLQTSLPEYPLATDAMVLNASQELSDEFPYNADYNSGDMIGISWVQYTIQDGQRVSSSTAYLHPAVAARSNLDILLNTQVTKVTQTGTDNSTGTPIFRGVTFATSADATSYALNVTKEVILSAGAFQSPQLLLLSGIGNSTELSAVGIEAIVDLPGVGQNMQDHPLLSSSWSVANSEITYDDVGQNATLAAELMEEWETEKEGLLVLGPANQFGWLRIPDNSSIFETEEDPSAGPTAGHYELIFTDGFVSFAIPTPSTGHYFSMFSNVVTPASRGSLTLASSDPFAAPLIDPGLLNSDFDIFCMVEAIKAMQTYATASAFDGYLLEPYGPFADAVDDASIEAYARNYTTTVWHATSSCSMAPADSTDGCLNPDLSVKGTIGLRVVDASAMPYIPSAHTQAPTYILAERAADIIKAANAL
ncbi:alcohol oxidase [Stereum hirsutum FP-91666 SS1]|uniref:alcohol oxidase n=1 Tax=Stereum hirsutum (strain FP-91666) TaxID=721885 RepID=UPI0004449460|nr:alcohol oxidase [Stereum hirsutum FP-91666 SS1]EIM83807.1 alcohol oxidase [Stereum hirsutum FP-91666 SS1]